MTDIEQKALALVNEIEHERGEDELTPRIMRGLIMDEALCRAIDQIEDLRQPKTVTFTVVSAADGNPMHTFKIDPTKKTILRPLHSMIGYVFEPEEQSK
jgi:hypothetical protein